MKSLVIAASVAVAIMIAGCGPLKYQVKSSDLAAGADAEIVANVKKDQGMTMLTIAAVNLAPAARIKEGRDTFEVWQRKNKDFPWSRVGSLAYNEGARTGTIQDATVSEMAFDVQVTLETGNVPEAPSDEVIFKQRIEG